jgi:hypothetical protein
MGLSLIVPAPIIHKSRVNKIDERATRPMLRTAFHLAVPLRTAATWSPLNATTVTNSWLTVVVLPSESGLSAEKMTPSRAQPPRRCVKERDLKILPSQCRSRHPAATDRSPAGRSEW